MYRAKDAKVHNVKMIGTGARLTMSGGYSWLAGRDDCADVPGFIREACTKTEGFKIFSKKECCALGSLPLRTFARASSRLCA
jgi:hypothetical protein